MISLLLSRPYIQVESYWIPQKYVCHYWSLIFCNSGRCSTLWMSFLGCFPPYKACIVSVGITKASPQRENFKNRSSSGLWALVSKLHIVFRNRDLPSISRKQLRAIAIDSTDLGSSWKTLTNNFKEELSYLVFVMQSMTLVGKHCYLTYEISFKLYMFFTQPYMYYI